MGRDTTAGRLRLDGDGRLALDWPRREATRYFARVWRTVGRIAAASDWDFRKGLSDRLSRSITAHPLGGAPMGRDRWEGVVDDHGEVHGHRGLFVADGAVLPGPIGANPSLTIAALAERFADRITED
jgi:cholesterol oxidase